MELGRRIEQAIRNRVAEHGITEEVAQDISTRQGGDKTTLGMPFLLT